MAGQSAVVVAVAPKSPKDMTFSIATHYRRAFRFLFSIKFWERMVAIQPPTEERIVARSRSIASESVCE